jgi:hypothetical protein
MSLSFANKTFRGAEPTWANACVGDNGAPGIIDYASGFAAAANALIDSAIASQGIALTVDTLVYPVCFTMRHAIELFLKASVVELTRIAETRTAPLPRFSLSSSHDLRLIWNYVKEHAFKSDARLAELVSLLEEYVLDVAKLDATGQVFRYPFDTSNKKHLTEIGVINFIVLKQRFNQAEHLLHAFTKLTSDLVDEYSWGTFTRTLSRQQLLQISGELPPRDAWKEEGFDSTRRDLMARYKLSAKELSKALNLIQKRPEMATRIGVHIPIPGLSIEALCSFFDQWCQLNELKDVVNPQAPRIVHLSDLDGTLADHAKANMVAEALAHKLSCDEFAAIEALFDFEDEAPFSEAFDRLLTICQRDAERHKVDGARYQEALRGKLEGIRAFERILYSLDLLGQRDALEALIDRYGLAPARERLLERSTRRK